jgi:hypothetical protein
MNSRFGKFFFWTDFILQKGQKYFTSQAENIVFDNQSNL